MTILTVDDDIDDQDIFIEAMKCIDTSITCIKADGGLEACTILLDGDLYLSIDYIFLDINMPKMNGIEFLKMMKHDKRLNKIPVYILSTSCSPTDMATINSLGSQLLQKQNQFQKSVEMLDSVIHNKERIAR